jgi:ABC-type transporter Mla subunit MlaD
MPWMWAAAGAAISAGGAIFGANEQKKAAKRAAREAARLRRYYEQKAGETRRVMNQEIETLRVLRDLDMPAFQQAAATAAIQARRGQDRAARYRQVGRTGMQMRDQLLGDMLGQYLGREQQQMQQRVQTTQQIIQATSAMQSQVNQLLMAGGSASQQFTQQSLQLRAAAGQSISQAIGAVGQGLSAYGASAMENQQQTDLMAQQATQNQAQMEGMFRAGAANTYMQQNPGASPQQVQQYMMGMQDLSWMWGSPSGGQTWTGAKP